MAEQMMGQTGAPAEVVRERLLREALELFTRKGYAAASVREIVAAAGVTKPVLYYYFGSKEGLYLELMNNTYGTFTDLMTQLASYEGTVRERIVHFCTGIFDAFVEHIAVARLIYAIFFGPPQGAPHFPHEQYFDKMLDAVGAIAGEGIARGELKPFPPRDIAWAVMAALNAVMEEQLCHTPPRIDRDGLIRILNLTFNGLGEGVHQ